MARLRVARLDAVPPAEFVRAARAALAREGPDPILLLAPLRGEAVMLGRHQRAASALAPGAARARGLAVVRRVAGGRALLAGEGALGLFAVAPPGAALFPGPFAVDKVMNRYVRGLLAGLRQAGARASAWLGRDFVSCDSRRVALVSQEGTPEGATAFEAVIAVSRDLALPPGLSGYPAHPDARAGGPPPASVAEVAGRPVEVAALMDAIVAGYAAASGLAPAPLDAAAEGPEPLPVEEAEAGLAAGGPRPIAIGFAEALVRREGGRIAEARLRGDFIAPAFAVRALEESLAGCPLDYAEVGRRVDAAFRAPGACIHGVPALAALAEAVLAAGGGALASA